MDSAGEKNISTVCLMVLTGIVLAFALYFAKPVLVPFVVALFLSYAVAPVADFLQTRTRVPRIAAILATILLGLLMLSLTGLLVFSSFKGLADNLDLYQQKIAQMAADVVEPLEKLTGEIDAQYIRDRFRNLPFAGILQSTLGNFAVILSNSFLIIVFVVYLISGRHPGAKSQGVFSEIDSKVKKYISLKILISAATGLLVGFTLWLIGLNLAIVFGLLAFLLNLIPTIGSIFATLLPIPVALVQFEGFLPVALVVLIPGSIQITIGNFIEPRVLGDSLELHPITVLLSLVFWGMVWGALGMFVAVPITAVIKIVLGHIEHTRPVARLMAGHLE